MAILAAASLTAALQLKARYVARLRLTVEFPIENRHRVCRAHMREQRRQLVVQLALLCRAALTIHSTFLQLNVRTITILQ